MANKSTSQMLFLMRIIFTRKIDCPSNIRCSPTKIKDAEHKIKLKTFRRQNLLLQLETFPYGQEPVVHKKVLKFESCWMA